MKLSELMYGVPVADVKNAKNSLDILSVSCETSRVMEKSLFVCIGGSKTDSHELAGQAIQNGAVALVVSRVLDFDVPQIVVDNTRLAMSLIAANFYGNPANFMRIIQVTGTNGKTTTSNIIASILRSTGKKVGIIGTSGIYIDKTGYPSQLTTPDPLDLHATFATMKEANCEFVVMEASAHAIYLDKLEGIIADIGVYTNLSQDHLDFFGSMDKYAAAKRRLFSSRYIKRAVVNVDCPQGLEIAADADVPVVTYGCNNPSEVFCVNYSSSENGISFIININDKIYDIKSPLFGKYNMYNIMAAATACYYCGIPLNKIARGIAAMQQVPGRHNVIKKDGKRAVIDYAHTPDGIVNVLSAIREYTKGRIITVFGCGGNRDSSKRPLMGAAAHSLSDYCIITSDNPRFEDPDSIIEQVAKNINMGSGTVEKIADRQLAIERALSLAAGDDTVAILGKGDETTQEIMGIKYPFDDLEVVRGCLGLNSNEYTKPEFSEIAVVKNKKH